MSFSHAFVAKKGDPHRDHDGPAGPTKSFHDSAKSSALHQLESADLPPAAKMFVSHAIHAYDGDEDLPIKVSVSGHLAGWKEDRDEGGKRTGSNHTSSLSVSVLHEPE